MGHSNKASQLIANGEVVTVQATAPNDAATQPAQTHNAYASAARRLHHYLVAAHWKDDALIGPDPGIRFNYRIGRFIKSAFSFVPWRDDLYYLQGQGYWILSNLALYAQSGDPSFQQIAVRCGATILRRQRTDGAWDYPNPEWQGRVATAEGTWASLGLLQLYRQTRDERYLAGVLRWYDYLANTIGFQQVGDELAINYFAQLGQDRVPNNSITVLRFLAEVADATGDAGYQHHCSGLLTFIQNVQKPSGEFPYAVGSVQNPTYYRGHFQCVQYNAFECLNLIRYHELTREPRLPPIIARQVSFLLDGQGEDGHAYYQCDNRYGAVTYHTAALGAALLKADRFGLPGCLDAARRAYEYVVRHQRFDGSFPHSHNDYRLLTDQRSYPRYLAMILFHLVQPELLCAF